MGRSRRTMTAPTRSGHDDPDERRVPVPSVGEVEPRRDAEDSARRERGLHDAHHAAAHVEREEVSGDRGDDGADDATEQARHHACDEQHLVRAREAAQERAEDEAAVEEEQEALPFKAVRHARREEPRGRRAEGVRRHGERELPRRDVQGRHELGAERRHDREVQDDGELEEREQRQHEALVGAHGRGARTHRAASLAKTEFVTNNVRRRSKK